MSSFILLVQEMSEWMNEWDAHPLRLRMRPFTWTGLGAARWLVEVFGPKQLNSQLCSIRQPVRADQAYFLRDYLQTLFGRWVAIHPSIYPSICLVLRNNRVFYLSAFFYRAIFHDNFFTFGIFLLFFSFDFFFPNFSIFILEYSTQKKYIYTNQNAYYYYYYYLISVV